MKAVEEQLVRSTCWQTTPASWGLRVETGKSTLTTGGHTFDVNLRGSFLFARAALPGMIARHRGRIINISSASVNIHLPYASAYGVSKAA